MKKCLFCAEEIKDEAIKCRHCGEMLTKLKSAKMPLQLAGETDLVKTHPVWMSFLGNFFLAATLLPFAFIHWSFVLISIIIVLWAILSRDSTVYTVTSKRVIVQRGVFSKHRDDIDIKDIRNITTKQSISQSFINCGNVLIGTAGTSGYEIIISDISEYQRMADLIRSQK